MNKQSHLKTISVLGLTAIILLFSFYFPLVGLVLFSISVFIAIYMAIYALFKD